MVSHGPFSPPPRQGAVHMAALLSPLEGAGSRKWEQGSTFFFGLHGWDLTWRDPGTVIEPCKSPCPLQGRRKKQDITRGSKVEDPKCNLVQGGTGYRPCGCLIRIPGTCSKGYLESPLCYPPCSRDANPPSPLFTLFSHL